MDDKNTKDEAKATGGCIISAIVSILTSVATTLLLLKLMS